MTCSEYRQLMLDVARGVCRDSAAVAHAQYCSQCETFLERQTSLTTGFGIIARNELREPNPALEAALLKTLSRRRQPPYTWGWIAPVSVAAAATFALLYLPRPSVRQPVAQRVSAPAPISVVRNVPASAALPPRGLAVRRPSRSRPSRVVSPPETAAEFLGIPYAIPIEPHERAELVHANMPVAALAEWGLTTFGMDPSVRVNVDLVLGEDGLARAVHLVR